jgi:hypothetical protein
MSGVQEQFEIKFRLPDGTDIGPRRFPPASTVATLKETIIAQWPKGESPHARCRGRRERKRRLVLSTGEWRWSCAIGIGAAVAFLGRILPLERPPSSLES